MHVKQFYVRNNFFLLSCVNRESGIFTDTYCNKSRNMISELCNNYCIQLHTYTIRIYLQNTDKFTKHLVSLPVDLYQLN